MEDKILSALNDIAKGIEEIANASKRKANNSTNSILQSVDLGKRMDDIKNNVRNIKKDTEKILKNQETLIRISKDKNEKNSPFLVASSNTNKLKSGVSTVLLIASGVLAIGLAFKLIGQVNFMSVIALSISLPLVAIAFEKIAELKGLKNADMKSILYSVVTMSTALMLSSWVLSLVRPISVSQGLTAILIGVTFATLGLSIEKIAKSVRNIRPIDLIILPTVLLAMSLSITLSSQILRGIHPISIAQGLTAILISGMFAVVSLSIEKITNGIKNVKANDIIKLPFVLLAFATAITASSWVMNLITPITFTQALTGIAISATLALMSLALPALSYAVNKTNLTTAAKMVAILPLLALSIALSSWALQLVKPVKELGHVVLLSITIGLSSLAMAGTIWAINKMNLNLSNIIEGGLSIVALATTMMLSSWILSVGNYTKFPTLEWAAGVGLSLVAFGLSAIVLGTIAMSGAGALALLAGAASILSLAGVVVATSFILGKGAYEKYPSFEWSSGVALSLAAFGAGTILLGSFIVGSLGIGLAALATGAVGIDIIANSIVSASSILGTGTYTGGPTKEWAEGISLALGAFAPVFETIFNRGIIGIFSKGPSSKDFSNAIITVSKGIMTAGEFFAGKTGIWSGGPTAEWAAGVGGAIGAFTPVFDALSKSSGLFGSGPKPDDMIQAMLGIANGIVQVGQIFSAASGNWAKAPTAEWASGVSSAIGAFSPIFDFFNKNKDNGWFDNSSKDLNNTISTVAQSIVDVSNTLSKGNFSGSIPNGYLQSMSDNIKIYIELIDYLQSKDIGPLSFVDTFSVTYGLSQLSKGYDALSKSIKSLGVSLNSIDMDKLSSLKSLTGSVVLMSLMDPDQLEKVMDAFESKMGVFVKVIDDLNDTTSKDKGYGTLSTVKTPNTDKGATTDDLYNVLIQINNNTLSMVKGQNAMVNIFDELRNNNNSIKTKKQF